MMLENQGDEKTIVALFSDIRGFSRMFEKLPAEKVYTYTNRYFARASEIVERYRGSLDNIVGDGLLAIWGKERWRKNCPFLAVRAALEMRMTLLRHNIQYKWESHFPLEIGVGVAMGEALHYRVGPKKHTIDTFFGSPVILASRLGEIAKHNRILVDTKTARTVNKWAKLQKVPDVSVPGQSRNIICYNVIGLMDFLLKDGERRTTSRIRFVFPEIVAFVFKKSGKRHPVILKNISMTGAGIEIVEKEDYDMRENDEITLDLTSFKLHKFSFLDGKIVQMRPISEETEVERRLSQVGIAFVNLGDEKKRALRALLKDS